MAQFQNMIITRAGLDMIAQSQAGGTLILQKVNWVTVRLATKVYPI